MNCPLIYPDAIQMPHKIRPSSFSLNYYDLHPLRTVTPPPTHTLCDYVHHIKLSPVSLATHLIYLFPGQHLSASLLILDNLHFLEFFYEINYTYNPLNMLIYVCVYVSFYIILA